MGHLRGGVVLALAALLGAAPAAALGFETGAANADRGDSADGFRLEALASKSLHIIATAGAAERMRQAFRGGVAAPADAGSVIGSTTPALGAKRMLQLAPLAKMRHYSGRKMAQAGGMWTDYGNDNRTLKLVAGAVASELGVHLIARPLGADLHLSPWTTKRSSGLAASFAF